MLKVAPSMLTTLTVPTLRPIFLVDFLTPVKPMVTELALVVASFKVLSMVDMHIVTPVKPIKTALSLVTAL